MSKMYLKLGLSAVFFVLFLPLVSLQGCDTSSDMTQCSVGQLCRNAVCVKALTCSSGSDCSGTPGTECVTEYCQSPTCTAAGQCVHGLVCSHNKNSRGCVYPVLLQVKENERVQLEFTEPGTVGSYEEITWSKGGKGSAESRIVFVHSSATGGKPFYYNEYCSGRSPCETSEKGEIDLNTGSLTIKKVQLSDEDYYYYKFYIDDESETGHKYQIKLEVYVTPRKGNLLISGISESFDEVGTHLNLLCEVNRTKPEAAEMFWLINGHRKNGSDVTLDNVDGTISQKNFIGHRVAKEDEGASIECVFVPVYGDPIQVRKTINPGYGPSGKPDAEPTTSSKHKDEKVILTCNNPNDDGNPDCHIYTWNKLEKNEATLPNAKNLEFIMTESWTGNYTCTCANVYGISTESNIAQVIFLRGPAPSVTAGGDAAVIGGAIGGIITLVIIVAAIVIICKKYRFSVSKRDAFAKSTSNPENQTEMTTCQQQSRDVTSQRLTSPLYEEIIETDDQYTSLERPESDHDDDGKYMQPMTNSNDAEPDNSVKQDGGYVNQAVVAQDYEEVIERAGTNNDARAYENIL